MQHVVGDIWDFVGRAPIVVPTNIGWTKAGNNVMGRGVAMQAAQRFPDLPEWYGRFCKAHGARTPVAFKAFGSTLRSSAIIPWTWADLILFPVKPLNEEHPWLSWQSRASLSLIERSLQELVDLIPKWPDPVKIVLPLVGCGNGGLSLGEVLPLLDKYLAPTNKFVLVTLTHRPGG